MKDELIKLTEEDLEKAQIECDKISKEHGLDKIHKDIIGGTPINRDTCEHEMVCDDLETGHVKCELCGIEGYWQMNHINTEEEKVYKE